MKIRLLSLFALIIFCFSVLGVTYAASATNTATSSTTQETKSPATTKKEDNKNNASPLTLNAKSAILMEASTGKILYENNSHEKYPPASITKIMSLVLVMEALDSGKIKITDKVVCSEYAASMGGSQIWLEPGEVMSVDDLLKATAVNSANDATVALGEFVAGSGQAFVAMMNKRAKELGMNDTTFINLNGLDAAGHVSSAYDIALMSRELLKHKKIFNYTTIWMGSIRDGKTALTNTNRLVRFYNGTNGLKTGSTSDAGCCISATALRNNMQLIAVAMGAPTSNDRFASAQKMLDYGFANWSIIKPEMPKNIPQVKVIRGIIDYSIPKIIGDAQILVPKGQEKSVTSKLILNPTVMAPVEKGQTLGNIVYMLNGEKVASIPIKAVDRVELLTFPKALGKLFSAFF
jgi:D-alanyl-D-alanine carboxypeptidase (penicillin-binding protein 5/6)